MVKPGSTASDTSATVSSTVKPTRKGTEKTVQPTLSQPENYESAIKELQQLIGQMEAGQLPLDQLLAQYQRGAYLLQYCRSRLQAVEEQIKVFEDDQIKPWDPSA